MKKALLVIVLMFMVGVCFALESSQKPYSIELKNSTGVRQISVIPTTSIRPLIDKLIGYDVLPLAMTRGAECYISIMDDTDKSLDGEVFAESEAQANFGKGEMWTNAKYINDGIVVTQGANTQVQIYFVRE